MKPALRRALGIAAALGLGAVAMVLATVCEPRTDACLLATPILGDVQVGDLAIRCEEAAIMGVANDTVWARALGLSPRVHVTSLGTGKVRSLEIRLENVNFRACKLEMSPGARELSRRGGSLAVLGNLREGPVSVAARVTPEALANGRFVVVGCTRTNSLMPQFLERLEADPPLFVLHLGDLSHGHAYEFEAVRASFDRIGVPIFVSPGNHDIFPLGRLAIFHRYLNPAPFAFTVAGQRMFVLDVSDYPILAGETDWLESGIRAAGDARSWIFLHRSPVDPLGLGREFPAKDGAARLEQVVAKAKDARIYAAHLGGYGTGTFGGHPFVMTSGGGEHHKRESPGPYHHMVVSLDGSEGKVVTYDEPGFGARIAARIAFEGPVFLTRPLLGLGVAVTAALLLELLSRRRRSSRKTTEPGSASGPEPRLEPREATAT